MGGHLRGWHSERTDRSIPCDPSDQITGRITAGITRSHQPQCSLEVITGAAGAAERIEIELDFHNIFNWICHKTAYAFVPSRFVHSIHTYLSQSLYAKL